MRAVHVDEQTPLAQKPRADQLAEHLRHLWCRGEVAARAQHLGLARIVALCRSNSFHTYLCCCCNLRWRKWKFYPSRIGERLAHILGNGERTLQFALVSQVVFKVGAGGRRRRRGSPSLAPGPYSRTGRQETCYLRHYTFSFDWHMSIG